MEYIFPFQFWCGKTFVWKGYVESSWGRNRKHYFVNICSLVVLKLLMGEEWWGGAESLIQYQVKSPLFPTGILAQLKWIIRYKLWDKSQIQSQNYLKFRAVYPEMHIVPNPLALVFGKFATARKILHEISLETPKMLISLIPNDCIAYSAI